MRRLQQWLRVNRDRISKWRELVRGVCLDSSFQADTQAIQQQQQYLLFESQEDAALLLQGHYMTFVDPDTVKLSSDGLPVLLDFTDVWKLRVGLAGNKRLCQMLGRLWRDRPDVAACVDNRALQALVQDLHQDGIDTAIILHCTEFLCKQFTNQYMRPGSQESRQIVNDAIQTYICAVDNSKHLRLDAGHWHELWMRGDVVAMHIVCMYLRHENRERLEANRNMINAAACINRNIQNLRDILSISHNVMKILKELWEQYPSFAEKMDLSILLRMAENEKNCSNEGHDASHGNRRAAYVQKCDEYFTNTLLIMLRFILPEKHEELEGASKQAPAIGGRIANPLHFFS